MRKYLAHLGLQHVGLLSLVVAIFTQAVVEPAHAVTPAEQLLPITTKGYLSIPDIEGMEAAFNETGLGQIVNDEEFKPFIEDLRKQLNDRLATTSGRLGISLDQLRSICAGEVCIAFAQPHEGIQKHAVIAIVDASGKEGEVAVLRASVDEGMKKRGGEKSQQVIAGIEVTKYDIPIKRGAKKRFQAFMFNHEGQLFAADHAGVVKQLIERLVSDKGNSLAEVKSFRVTIDRCLSEFGDNEPHIRWFVDPIGYAEVMRDAAAVNSKRKRSDMTAAMKAQGFDAVRGIGGLLSFANGKYDILDNTYVYAPALPKAGKDKYKLAARLLSKSIPDKLEVPSFIPKNVSSYVAAAWGIQESYEFIDTLVDEVAGEEGFFDDLVDSLKNDPNGPLIDIRKDLVEHLGEHVFAFTDAQLPVSPTSERMLLAIELTNADAMEASLKKALQTDPDARPMDFDDHIIWEIINEDSESVELEIEGAGEFGDIPSYDDEFADEAGALAALWSNAAISVVKGHLVIASHTDMVKEMIQNDGENSLAKEADYQAILAALKEVGDDNQNTFRLFSRADLELRTSYELIRQGRMPESEGFIGRLLNTVLAPKEKNAKRTQEVDGSKMPPFAKIQQHLGTIGLYGRPEEDGWYMSGVVAKRPQATTEMLNGQREAITTAKAEEEVAAGTQ